jgi:hypothetical protein
MSHVRVLFKNTHFLRGHMQEDTNRIHRHNYEKDFTTFSNKLFQDEYLSWIAKGLLSYIISRPLDWKIYRSQLSKIYKGKEKGNGKYAIDRAFQELISEGFIIYTPKHPETGKYIHRYDAYPERQKLKNKVPKAGYPTMDKPENGFNPPLQNTDSSTKNEKETNNERTNDVLPNDVLRAREGDDPPRDPSRLVSDAERSFVSSNRSVRSESFVSSEAPSKERPPDNPYADLFSAYPWIDETCRLAIVASGHPPDNIERRIKYTLCRNPENYASYLMTILKKPGDFAQPKTAGQRKQETTDENRMAVKKKYGHLDGQSINGWFVNVGLNCMEFSYGSHSKLFEYAEPDILEKIAGFKEQLEDL